MSIREKPLDNLPWGIFCDIVVKEKISIWDGGLIYSASVKRLDGNSEMAVQGLNSESEAVEQLINWVWRYYS